MGRWRDLAFAVVVGLVLWELAVRLFAIPQYVLPSPIPVLRVIVERRGDLLRHTGTTAGEALLGISAGVVFGVACAVVVTATRRFGAFVYSLLVWSQVVPKVALVPVFVIWFGFGQWPKVLIAFLIAFFPIVVDTTAGLQAVDREFGRLIRSSAASTLNGYRKIRIPGAMPHFFSGLKTAITLAVVGAVLGEFLGGERGLGYVLLSASSRLDTPLTFASILLMSLLGYALFELVVLLERVVVRWQRPSGPVLLSSAGSS